MERLEGVVQHYPWGDRRALAELLGRSPTGEPEAELWFGAHPRGPSTTADGRTLDTVIAAAPEASLGATTATTYGELPFMVKVLAAALPLSIQAHPNAEQARIGFARENTAGIAIDSAERCYRDAKAKSELICALTRFDALCGLRALDETRELFDSLGPGVEQVTEHLGAPGGDVEVLRATVGWLLAEADASVVRSCVEACRLLDRPGHAAAAQTAIDAAEWFGDDPGVVVSLLLNRVSLEPGEALSLGAGNLHAYLGGVGVEVMSNSDNVVRGGLTDKHVDVAELVAIADFAPTVPDVQRPDDWNHRYASGASEFTLHRYRLAPGRSIAWQRDAPAILLVTDGEATVDDQHLGRGGCVFLCASDAATIRGTADVYLATTN